MTVLVLLLPIVATVPAEFAAQQFGSLLVTIAMASFGHLTKHREAVPWALAAVYTLTALNAHYLDAPVSGASPEAAGLLRFAATFAPLKIFETTYTPDSLFSSMLLRGNACHSVSMCAFPKNTCQWKSGGLTRLRQQLTSSCGMTNDMLTALKREQSDAQIFTGFLRANMQSVAHNIMCVGMAAFLLGRYTPASRGGGLSVYQRAVQLPVARQQVLTDTSLFGAPCVVVMLSVIFSWYFTHIFAFYMRAADPSQFVDGKFLTQPQSLRDRMEWWIFVRSPWPPMTIMMGFLMVRRYCFARTRSMLFDFLSATVVWPFLLVARKTNGWVILASSTLAVLTARNKRFSEVDAYDIAFFLGVAFLFFKRDLAAHKAVSDEGGIGLNVPFG